MKGKLSVSSLFIVLLTGLVLAATSISVIPSNLGFSLGDTTGIFVIKNGPDEAVNITFPSTAQIESGGNIITFSLSTQDPVDNVAPDGTVSIDVVMSGNFDLFDFGEYATTVTIDAVNATNETLTDSKDVTFKFVRGFCEAGPQSGNLTINNVDIDNKGDGDDEEWELLDIIEIEFEVENVGDDDLDEVFVEIGLFDSDGRNVADDLEYENEDEEEFDLGRIKDGDEEEETFVFRVPADFDDGTYKLVIKVYDDDLGENVVCSDETNDFDNDFFQTISIDRKSDDEKSIIVEDIFMDDQLLCGETASGEFTVFNIGENDEERVLIEMTVDEIGIMQEFEITSDFDEGDDEEFLFNFEIPDDAEEKRYVVEFETFFNYKKGIYRDESEDTFFTTFNVIGECFATPSAPTDSVVVSASLGSDPAAGEELVVNAIITNIGLERATIAIDAHGFESWAELNSLSPRLITLEPGQNQAVILSLQVDEDASGSKVFVIETNIDGNIEVQEVEVNLPAAEEDEEDTTGFFDIDFKGNSLIWLIAIINIILIVLIIVVAVRLARR